MAQITIALEGAGDCTAVHGGSGTSLRTSKSPAFGGSGRSFSSTDLLGVALGTCIATDLEKVAERNGLDLADIRLDVDKTFAESPKRIDRFDVKVRLPESVDDVLLLKLRRAAAACLVQRSLNDAITIDVAFFRGEVRASDD